MEITAICALAAAGALLEYALPATGSHSQRKGLNTLLSLIFLLLLMRPLTGLADSLPSLTPLPPAPQEHYEGVLDEALRAGVAAELERAVHALVCEEFSLDDDQLTVGATLDAAGLPQALRLRLSGGGLLRDPDDIKDFLANKISCEIEVR